MSSPAQPSLFDRALRIFADVRPGEGALAVLLALNVFLILTTYCILKPRSRSFDSRNSGRSRTICTPGKRENVSFPSSALARHLAHDKVKVALAAAFLGLAVLVGRAYAGRKAPTVAVRTGARQVPS